MRLKNIDFAKPVIYWLDHRIGSRGAYAIILFFSLLIILQVISLMQNLWLPELSQPNNLPIFSVQKLPDIAEWHLFGVYIPSEFDLDSLPETSLPITLIGTFMTNPQQAATAVISIDGNEKLYALGDKIMDSASVYKILTNCIILKDNGNLEILRMPQSLPTFSPPPAGLNLP